MLTTSILAITAMIASRQSRPAVKVTTLGGTQVSVERRTTNQFCLTVAIRLPQDVSPAEAHLFEHLVIGQDDGRLLVDLDDRDVRLVGSTSRFQLNFVFTGPAGAEQVAIAAIPKLISPRTIAQAKIARELDVLAEESALQSPTMLTANELWEQAWPVRGSLFPAPDVRMDSIDDVRAKLLRQSGIAVSLIGTAEAEDAALAIAANFDGLPGGTKATPELPVRTSLDSDGAFGVFVGPVGSISMLTTLGITEALAARVPGTTILSNFQGHGTLMVVTMPRENAKSLGREQRQSIIRDAIGYTRRWLESLTSDEQTASMTRASYMLAGGTNLYDLIEGGNALEWDDYEMALRAIDGYVFIPDEDEEGQR